VPLERRQLELSVERPLGPDRLSDGTVHLTVRFEVSPGADSPTPQELAKALDVLRADLDALVGAPLAAVPARRVDRELSELVEAYRPRQRELVDLLRDDGEITDVEHARLAEYLAGPAGPRTIPERMPEPILDQPIAAIPIGASAAPTPVRSVDELLRTFQISSLKQAGAVRARRQISFSEYMALKRHFESDAGAEKRGP
jgi:hypothetical protein